MQIRGPQRPTICGVQIFGGFFSVRNVKLSLPWWIAQFEAERRFFLLFQYHSAIYNYMKYLRSTKSSVSDIFTEVNLLLNDQFVTEGIQIRHQVGRNIKSNRTRKTGREVSELQRAPLQHVATPRSYANRLPDLQKSQSVLPWFTFVTI